MFNFWNMLYICTQISRKLTRQTQQINWWATLLQPALVQITIWPIFILYKCRLTYAQANVQKWNISYTKYYFCMFYNLSYFSANVLRTPKSRLRNTAACSKRCISNNKDNWQTDFQTNKLFKMLKWNVLKVAVACAIE